MDTERPSSFVTPEVVISHFHIKDGDTLADFGAGSGFYLKELSKRAGGNGLLYACEIQKALVEKIGEQSRRLGLTNIHPLWCDLEEAGGIKIKDEALDVGVLANTLFQIEAKETAVIEMGRTIKKGGRLIIIDWTDSFGGMGPVADHVITSEETTALLETHGFVLEQTFPAGSHHYGLVFRKI